ncbi:spore coat protein U-like protein [Variovorax sp. GrIS 2.14]|uniref:Csu type fimbrial protein n=1 Tax=Variovorax sp. GrIS 2.14 TaxID=3071709 RepID=UPI0038F6FE60
MTSSISRRLFVLPAMLCIAGLTLHGTRANAASAIATFQVTATVLTACAVVGPGTLAFGSYTPSSDTPLAGSTSFTVVCTFGTPYSVGLSVGLGSGATLTARKMTSSSAPAGNNLLTYGLFKESTFATSWDNSVTGTGYVANGVIQPYTIYGQIPIGQYNAGPAVNYADTVTLTLTY